MNPDPPIKPDYSVKIELLGEAHFKVTWNRGLAFRTYMIARGDVEDVSENIRTQLGSLVTNALIRDKAATAKDASKVKAANADERAIMETLVAHCRELYETLFRCESGSEASQAYVDQYIRDQIRRETTPKSICFLAEARVYVPWGLLYDGSLAANADPGNPAHFGGFWCLKHQVSTIYDTIASPHDFVVTYDSSAFHLVSGGDNAEFTKAKRALKGQAAERKWVAQLLKGYGRPATSSIELVDAWRSNEKRIGLLYLFCHASARMIGFSGRDTMSVRDFKKHFTKSAPSPRCLVFLNGCYTTNPDPKGTFFEAIGQEGFCGYIGSETEVPAIFAFRFGLAFQHLFYQGIEVVDVMSRLRLQHWPLSLIYGLYAFPHVRVTQHLGMAAPALPRVNYSAGPLGEKIG
jgi:hypothetical protein